MLTCDYSLIGSSVPLGPLLRRMPRKEQSIIAARAFKLMLMIVIVSLKTLLLDLLDRVELIFVINIFSVLEILTALV